MASGGNGFVVDFRRVRRKLEEAIERAKIGSVEATTEALATVRDMALEQVPRQTNTLASSYSDEVMIVDGEIVASLGFAGEKDLINPITGKPASDYVLQVHEDLSVYHPHGKAKFLEDPVRTYAEQFLPGAAAAVRSRLK